MISVLEGLSFKEKKAKKLKAQAKSSHNWNVLFLGNNAVADVIASTYNTTKEQLLNDNNKSELSVPTIQEFLLIQNDTILILNLFP